MNLDKIDFTGKVVIVTGASSGIGAETAKLFAERKATLTLVGRDATRLLNTAKECENRNGLTPLCLQLDLTHHGNCESVISKTVETYGRIDVLVNCAGKVKVASVYDTSMEVFDELLAINLRVPYHLTQLAIPYLLRTKGNVVNVGSSLSKRYRPGFLPYAVSKSGLEKFTKHSAPELGAEGMRINAVCPGVTRTNILENFNIDNQSQPYVYRSLAEHMPTGEIIEPKEVATMIVLAASDVFPNLNGSALLLDGTWSCCVMIREDCER